MRLGIVMGTGHGARGTTGQLVDQLVERVAATGDLTVDTVCTDDLDLGPSCPACLSCMTAGEQACPSYDRTAPARRVMDEADLVLFATPVHSFHVSATMKRFVDHFAYLIHRPAYVGKPAALVSTAAGAGHDAALGYLRTAVRAGGSTPSASSASTVRGWPRRRTGPRSTPPSTTWARPSVARRRTPPSLGQRPPT
ncbi:MAG: flavodoxin family protein [Nocardioides sp.]|uniref:flavodoxin family protein n=1 Tax=Nocardioides sp. TaxID=35761 RepID=UPI003F0C221A